MKNKDKLKKYYAHFGDDDIVIQNVRFNSVHFLPENFCEIGEVDFYMDTGEDIFLLRFINSDKNKLTFVAGEPIYIIVEKRVSCNVMEELENSLILLENIGIPQHIEKQISFAI